MKFTNLAIAEVALTSQSKFCSSTKKFEKMDELRLIEACRTREVGAFEELLRRHKRSISNIIYRLAPDTFDSDDICQEAAIKIWRAIPSLQDPTRFRAWIKRIVTNIFYDRLRATPSEIYIVSLDEPRPGEDSDVQSSSRDFCDNSLRPDELVLRAELRKVMMTAISNVPDIFRIPMCLRDDDELSYEEIALLTQTRLGTVKSRISRARLKAKRNLMPYFAECGTAA